MNEKQILTDEQIEDLWVIAENLDPIIGVPTYLQFARAILALKGGE